MKYATEPARREANAERNRLWRERNPEKVRKAGRDYYARNKKKVAATNRRCQVMRLYGLTMEEYEEILARPCAICGSTEEICLDHDHTSGKPRDALCRYCNLVLGNASDDPARLEAAAEYLRSHETSPS